MATRFHTVRQKALKTIIASTHIALKRENIAKWLPIVIVISLATVSFAYAWYLDPSKPDGGIGWADQDTYRVTAEKLSKGTVLSAQDLHFSIGYSLLAAAVPHLFGKDPFMYVSYTLFISSVLLCYFAGKKLFGVKWTFVFLLLLFWWDGVAKTFNYASELFAVPWNNQVLFFTFAFYLWLFVCRVSKDPSWKLIISIGLVSGYTFLTREESILFAIPAVVAFLWLTRADWKKWIAAIVIIFLCFMPQIITKATVLGNVTDSGKDQPYSSITKQYFQLSLLQRNSWEVLINPSHYGPTAYVPAGAPSGQEKLFERGGPNPGRKSVLQAAPWLWLAPVGFVVILAYRRYPDGLKIFVLISAFLLMFYLSGVNMSGQKLKFHAIRYITPGFIALNLATTVALYEAVRFGSSKTKKL